MGTGTGKKTDVEFIFRNRIKEEADWSFKQDSAKKENAEKPVEK